MSGVIRFSTARRQTRATQHAGWMTGGAAKIYDGTKPASTDTAVTTQVLLAAFPLPDPLGTTTAGVIVVNVNDIDPALVVSTGTRVATWARMEDENGVAIADYDAGITGSNNALELDSTSLAAGAYVSITSFTVAEG